MYFIYIKCVYIYIECVYSFLVEKDISLIITIRTLGELPREMMKCWTTEEMLFRATLVVEKKKTSPFFWLSP